MSFEPDLKKIEEMSKNCGGYLLTLFAACGYMLMTIVGTSDLALITGTSSTTLPFIQAPISTTSFYFLAPWLLVALFLYFHLNLQDLWQHIRFLPLRFPDGKQLGEVAYPWQVTKLAQLYAPRYTGNFYDIFLKTVLLFTVYGAVPVVIMLETLRCIRLHDTISVNITFDRAIWFGLTDSQVCVLTLSIWMATRFFLKARATLSSPQSLRRPYSEFRLHALIVSLWNPIRNSWRKQKTVMTDKELLQGAGESCDDRETDQPVEIVDRSSDCNVEAKKYAQRIHIVWWYIGRRYRHYHLVIELVIFACLGWFLWNGLSTAITNDHSKCGWACSVPGVQTGLKIDNADVSTRINGWTDPASTNEPAVVGANLTLRDLRYIQASGAFLAKSDLRGSDLSHGYFINADLRDAKISKTDLTPVRQADLHDADLHDAHLEGANLSGADLAGANLSHAKLSGAEMSGVDLHNADLTYAVLDGAHLGRANLRDTKLKNANLSKADLRGAALLRADFTGTNLDGADLRDTTNCVQSIVDSANSDKSLRLPPWLHPRKRR